MRTKRLMLLWLLALATFVGSFMLFKKVVWAQERVALTAIETESNYDRSGTLRRATIANFIAIRSDGSTVHGRTIPKPGNRGIVEQRKIRDVSKREEISIDGLTDSVGTVPITAKNAELQKRMPTCTTEDPTKRGSMLGYDIVRVVKDFPSNRYVRLETWLAPALNCFPLKEILYVGTSPNDLYTARVKEVTKVTLGDPPSILFEKPAEYVEMSPSQSSKEFFARYPEIACPKCQRESDRLHDETYYRRRNEKK